MKLGFMLSERQLEVFQRWQATLDQKLLQEAFEEDCSCASPFVFEYYPTGLGDVITVRFGEQELHLGIDDDNIGAWPASLGRKYA